MEQLHKSAVAFDALPTEELEQLLKSDYDGTQPLSLEDIIAICQILVRRKPVSQSAQAAWQQFLRCYMPPEDANAGR